MIRETIKDFWWNVWDAMQSPKKRNLEVELWVLKKRLEELRQKCLKFRNLEEENLVLKRQLAANNRPLLCRGETWPVWVGCGECDVSFNCFNGRLPCIRLPTATIQGDTSQELPANYGGSE